MHTKDSAKKSVFQSVVIVGNHPVCRRGFVEIFKAEWGAGHIVEAGDVRSALALIGKRARPLFVLDTHEDGLVWAAGIAQIKQAFPNGRVAVMSGSLSPEGKRALVAAGAIAFMSKSLDVADIVAVIRRALDGDGDGDDAARSGGRHRGARGAGIATKMSGVITRRQRDVFRLLSRGLSSKEIARRLDISEGTVKIHLAAIYRQLGVRNRLEAVLFGLKAPGVGNVLD